MRNHGILSALSVRNYAAEVPELVEYFLAVYRPCGEGVSICRGCISAHR